MTINVAVVTSDALIIGCDSIASTTQWLLDPFGDHTENFVGNPDGSCTLNFRFENLTETVTNAWGGVTKMFQISQWPMPTVAAVTAGLAKLNGLPISSLAGDFLESRKNHSGDGVTVEGAVASRRFVA